MNTNAIFNANSQLIRCDLSSGIVNFICLKVSLILSLEFRIRVDKRNIRIKLHALEILSVGVSDIHTMIL